MSDLSSEIAVARDRAIRRVDELHDDYFLTNQIWLGVLVRQRYGEAAPTFTNVKTGNVVMDWAAWIGRSRESRLRLRIRTFKDLSAQVELFTADLLRVWLPQFPAAMLGKSITLGEILAGSDLADVKTRAIAESVEDTILDKLKSKPATWFGYLKMHLGCRRTDAEIQHFAERKAARDVLEHHEGTVDDGYVKKAGAAAVYAVGDHFEPADPDIDALYDLVRHLIAAIATDAQAEYLAVSKAKNP